MSLIACRHCGMWYRKGYYSSHRVTQQHLDMLTGHYARYASQVMCNICGDTYEGGRYNVHARTPEHVALLKKERFKASRNAALAERAKRDADIIKRLSVGESPTDIGRFYGITRQRVHQIRNTVPKYVSTSLSVCFVCGDPIIGSLTAHRESRFHEINLMMFKEAIRGFRTHER